MRHWVEAYDVDGFRCDVAEWIPYGFWAESIAELRAIKPVLMLAEGADPGLHAAGFDVMYGWPLYAELKSVWDGASAQGLRDLVLSGRLPAGAQRLRFTTNHDETAWDRTPPQRFGGQQGARAASLLTYTLQGIPLLYNGQETGREEPVPFFEKTRYDWDANPEMRAFYKTFFDFYHNSDALRGGGITFHSTGDDVLVYSRQAGDEEVVAVINVRPGSRTATLPAALKSTGYVDVFRGEPTAARQTVPLEPFGFRLLASQ